MTICLNLKSVNGNPTEEYLENGVPENATHIVHMSDNEGDHWEFFIHSKIQNCADIYKDLGDPNVKVEGVTPLN